MKKYVIIDSSRISEIDFSQVDQTSADKMRYSLDGSQTFIKYEGERPDFLDGDDIELTHAEVKDVLSHSDWSNISPF